MQFRSKRLQHGVKFSRNPRTNMSFPKQLSYPLCNKGSRKLDYGAMAPLLGPGNIIKHPLGTCLHKSLWVVHSHTALSCHSFIPDNDSCPSRLYLLQGRFLTSSSSTQALRQCPAAWSTQWHFFSKEGASGCSWIWPCAAEGNDECTSWPWKRQRGERK